MTAWAMAIVMAAAAHPSPAELFRERYAAPGSCTATGCVGPALPVLEAGRSGIACLRDVVPTIQVRRSEGLRWAIRATFMVRELDAEGWAASDREGRVSGLILAPDGSVQDLCIEPIHVIGERTLQLRLAVPGVDLPPTATARLDGRWLTPQAQGRVPLPAASGAGSYFQSGKLIDWLFGAGSNELIRLTVRSRQARVPLLIRGRAVGLTEKTVLVARDVLGDVAVGSGAGAVKLNRCRQLANDQGLIVECP